MPTTGWSCQKGQWPPNYVIIGDIYTHMFILADAGQIGDNIDAELLQLLRRSDT
jgi:hypothetical protein